MRRVLAGLGILAMAAAATPGLAQEDDPILGIWTTEEQAEITVAYCPQGLCGYLSRIVIPEEYADSQDKIDAIGIENITDVKNKDPALRTRPLLGMPLLTLGRQLSATAFEGEIYNPEDGNTYYGKLQLVDLQRIKLTGCALIVLCQDIEWYRVPSDSPPPYPAAATSRPS
ncbi:MAG: DUF2147 domain-containing protein [Alphaproteobacteria bacterium]|nr:DUF2147 domain-containing protein [Alphaproteobacteria bacterium]